MFAAPASIKKFRQIIDIRIDVTTQDVLRSINLSLPDTDTHTDVAIHNVARSTNSFPQDTNTHIDAATCGAGALTSLYLLDISIPIEWLLSVGKKALPVAHQEVRFSRPLKLCVRFHNAP